MAKPEIIYNPATIAECGGPCEQGPEYCDCGELRIDRSPTNYSEPTTNRRTSTTTTTTT